MSLAVLDRILGVCIGQITWGRALNGPSVMVWMHWMLLVYFILGRTRDTYSANFQNNLVWGITTLTVKTMTAFWKSSLDLFLVLFLCQLLLSHLVARSIFSLPPLNVLDRVLHLDGGSLKVGRARNLALPLFNSIWEWELDFWLRLLIRNSSSIEYFLLALNLKLMLVYAPSRILLSTAKWYIDYCSRLRSFLCSFF